MPKCRTYVTVLRKTAGIAQVAFWLATLVLFTTCEALSPGLGRKVDITPPEVSITAPAANSYLKGDLVLSGSASDDRGVASLVISYPGTVTATVTDSVTVADGKWSYTVPYSGDKAIAEGEQAIRLTVTDNAGKSADTVLRIYVDNRAPTVLVTSPLAYEAPLTPVVRDYIDIKGEAYDDSPVSKVTVRLLKPDGSVIATKDAEGSATWFVRFTMAGITGAEKQATYSYDVSVTDKAGNASSTYFHRADIDAAKAIDVLFPPIDVLGKIEAGMPPTDSYGFTGDSLAALRFGTAAPKGFAYFKYDSEAKPTIRFTNIKQPPALANESTLGLGGVITGNISPQPGGGGMANIYANIYRSSDLAHPVNAAPMKDSNANSAADNVELMALGDSASFTFYLRQADLTNLPAGSYVIEVSGTSSGITGTLAAAFVIDAGAPIITETSLGSGLKYKNSAYSLGGVASSGTPFTTMVIKESYNGAAPVDRQTIDLSAQASPYSWSSATFTPAADGTYTYTIVLSTVSGNSTELTRTVLYDHSAPAISFNNTPSANVGGIDYFNGLVNFKANITDDNAVANVYSCLIPGNGSTTPAYTLDTATNTLSGASWTAYADPNKNAWTLTNFDTTVLTDKADYSLWVAAVDKIGNVSAVRYGFKPDQDSDIPSINFTNYDTNATKPYVGSQYLKGIVSDDDGQVSSISATVDGLPATVANSSGNFSIDMGTQGTKALLVTVVDAKGKSFSFDTGTKLKVLKGSGSIQPSAAMSIVIDTADPELTINEAQNRVIGTSFPLTGKASDSSGIEGAGDGVMYVDLNLDGDFLDAGETIALDAAGNWSATINTAALADGNHAMDLKVEDKSGRFTTGKFRFTLDKSAPTLAVSPVFTAARSLGTWLTNANVGVSGTANDGSGSGIARVEYSTDSGATWQLFSGSTAWTGYINYPEGDGNSLQIRAVDLAGNLSTAYNCAVKVDTIAPVLTETQVAAVAVPKGYNADIVFKGSVGDSGSGPASTLTLKYKLNGGGESSLSVDRLADFEASGYTFPVDAATHAQDGSYEFTLEAADAAGNKSSLSYSVTVETRKPVVTTNLVPSDAASGKYNGVDVPIKASVSDDSSIKSLYWQLSASSTAPAFDAAKAQANDTGANVGAGWNQVSGNLNSLSAVWDSTESGALSAGTRYLWIIACDRFGNLSVGDNAATPAANASLAVDQDTDIPLVSFTNYSLVAATPYLGELNLKAIVTDDDGTVGAVTATVDGSAATVANASGNISVDMGAQGSKSLVLTVTDAKGKPFSFDATTRLKLMRATATAQTAALTVVVDTEDPDLGIDTAQNQWMGSSFSLSGTAGDEFWTGAKSVTVSGAGITTFTSPVGGGVWNSGAIDTSALTEGASKSLTLQVTDDNGRTRSAVFQYKYDKTAPAVAVDAATLTRLSGWNKTATVAISGTDSDATSGVKSVEYSTDSTNGSDGNWNSLTLGTGTWSGNVTFPEGAANKLYLRASDNAGNLTILDADTGTAGLQPYTVKVDISSPLVSGLSVGDTQYLNGKQGLSFTVSGSDATSGLDIVQLKIDDNDLSAGTSDTTCTGGITTVTISAATINALSAGSHTAYLRLRDQAGLSSTLQSINLVKDITAPSLAFPSHADAALINKTVGFSGTASEANGLVDADVVVAVMDPSPVAATAIVAGAYYRIATPGTTDFLALGASSNAAGTSFKALAAGSGTGTVSAWINATNQSGAVKAGSWNWSLSGFDTTSGTWPQASFDADGGAAGYQLRVAALATDKAGNTGSAERLLTVDQDSDKPVAKLTNLAATGTPTLKQTTLIYGSLSDDDGSVTSLKMKNAAGDAWTTVALDGQSFTFSVTGADGAKNLYFEITDAAGTVFTTAASASGTTPRLYQSAGVYLETPLAFKLDTINPTIDNTVSLKIGAAAWGDYSSSSAWYGGTATGSFQVRVQAADANGIASVSMKITDSATGSVSQSATYDGSTWWTSNTNLDVTGLADGAGTLSITATDNSGLTATLSKAITIDNTAPSGSFLSPATLTVVNGDLMLKGLANDATSGIASIQYDIGNRGVWTAVSSGTYSWQVDFTGAGNINSYANSTYAVENAADGTWLCPILVRVYDKAGNSWTSGASDFKLTIDPSGDKPKVNVVYPYDYTKPVGGTVRIYGSATDDDAVYAMFMQIDANNNGDWTDDTNVAGVNWYNGGLGRQITGQNSWYQNINASGEFNPVSGTRTIQVRVRAQDTKNGSSGDIYGPWVQFPVIFDNNVPKIGNTHPLVLSRNTIYGDSDDQPYTYGSYITGSWYLLGSVEDEGSITSIIVNGGLSGSTGGANSSWFVPNVGNYDLQIPITTLAGSSGNVEFTVTGYDNTAPSARESALNIKLFYDNQAPTGTFTGSSPIQQSDGWYKLKGTALDVGSDISKVAVYLIRRNTNGSDTPAYEYDRFYNPLTGAEIAVGGSNRVTTAAGAFVTGSTYTIGSAGSTDFTTIGAGSNAVGTVFTATGPGSGSGTAYYDYPVVASAALINVDHKDVTEVHGSPITNDDADGLVESLKQTVGDTYSWYVDINSSLIKDGAVEVHYVVVDKAGNATHYQTNMEVKNNTPTLASTTLGTDLDGSGAVTSNEQVLVNTTGASTDASAVFIAKSAPVTFDLGVAGGNSTLLYTISCGSVTKNGTLRSGSGGAINTITLNASDLASIGDGTKTFTVTVWDSTEEKTAGVDSMSVVKSISTVVKVTDTVAPVATISPFFWNSSTDNSIYGNSRINGHIEITGVSDGTDPDVSGVVSIRGAAFDDQRLTALWMHIDGFAFTGASASQTLFALGADGVRNDAVDGTYYRVATYSAGTWTGTDQFAANGWKFTVTPVSLGQNGHSVTWQLDWDSSKVTNVAVNNADVRVLAEDKRSVPNASAESAVQTPLYTVDVVPYITLIQTSLSSVYTNSPSTYDRSAAGDFPVRENETITVFGFNFNTATTSSTAFSQNGTALTVSAVGTGSGATATYKYATLSTGVTATSGALTATVNSITSINQLNNNGNENNLEPNGRNNDLLTDDRNLVIWTFATLINNNQVWSPDMKLDSVGTNMYVSYGLGIDSFYIATNPNGNATGGGTFFESCYNKYESTSVGVDSSGNIYGTGMDTDRVSSTLGGATRFTFFSRAAGGNTWNYNNGTNKRHLELNYNSTAGVYNNMRTLRPDMTVAGAGTAASPSRIYLTYYDDITKENKFRYGQSTAADTLTYGIASDVASTTPGSATGYQAYANASSGTYRSGPFQAGGVVTGATVTAGSFVTGATYTIVSPGTTTFTSIGAANNTAGTTFVATGPGTGTGTASLQVAVLAWYDATNNQLVFSWNDTPSDTAQVAKWQTNARVIDSDYAGWYVDMAVDVDMGIHLAYYATSNGDLRYAYLSSYNQVAAPSVVTVDAYLSVGQQITITTKKTGGNNIPFISYLNISNIETKNSLKTAWQTNFTSLNNGANPSTELFTGDWEVMTVPTSEIPKQYRVSNGIQSSRLTLSYATNTKYEVARKK
jgi:hypothetical protein